MLGVSRTSRREAAPQASLGLPELTYDGTDLARGIKGAVKQFHRNKDIVVAGRHYSTLFVNLDGWLFRYKILHDGDRQIVDFILPGQIFGLQACLFQASLYSIETVTDTSVASIPVDAIDPLFDKNPGLAKALFRSAVRETAIVGEHLIDTARRSACARVGHLLLELFVRLRVAGQTDGLSFAIPLTQEIIGDAVGLTTVHVNRTLRALREDKLIQFGDKRITILDFEALSELSDFDDTYLGETAGALRRESVSQYPFGTHGNATSSEAPPRHDIGT